MRKKWARSVEEALQFLPQPGDDAKLGRVDRARRQTQLARDLGRRLPFDDQQPASSPGGRREILLHELHRPADQLLLILRFGEVGDVVGHRRLGGAALADSQGRDGATTLTVAPFVERHRPQPTSKTPLPTRAKRRQVVQQMKQNLLHQILSIGFLQPGAADPVEEQRSIELRKPRPGNLIGGIAKPFQ